MAICHRLIARTTTNCGRVDAMTLILRLPCNSCASPHDFYFSAETTVQPGALYGYVCSATKLNANFIAPDLDKYGEDLPSRPRGAIEARRVQVGI